VFVEAFLAELTVKALGIAVLHQASGRDEVQHNLVLVSPSIEPFRSELCAVAPASVGLEGGMQLNRHKTGEEKLGH